MTIVMLVMIALAVVVAAVALVYVALTGRRLYRAVRETQAAIQPSLDYILEQQQKALDTMERIQRRQMEIEQNSDVLARAGENVAYLTGELTEAVKGPIGRPTPLVPYYLSTRRTRPPQPPEPTP